MNIKMPVNLAAGYKSPAQGARVVTEGWAAEEMYCPACSQNRLAASPPNTRAVDFECRRCSQAYQLKGKSSAFAGRVIDGAYTAMMAALTSDTAPNLLLLHYSRTAWTVANLLLVPAFAFPPSAIECGKPLATPPVARAGLVASLSFRESRLKRESHLCEAGRRCRLRACECSISGCFRSSRLPH